jgi:hypothetical protein
MPNPINRPIDNRKSLANLKKGGSSGRKKVTPDDREVKKISKRLLLNPTYQKNLKDQLFARKVHPSVEVLLYYYAFGRPAEKIETKQEPVPVRILHVYAEDDK